MLWIKNVKRMLGVIIIRRTISGSIMEMENGAYLDKSSTCQREDGDSGCSLRKDFIEESCDRAALEQPSPSICNSEALHSNKFLGSGVLDGSPSGKMKFLCSFGGKFFPRPGDSKLKYMGGETRIISIQKTISWDELVKKTLAICNQPHTIKYYLPGEDHALISVSSDEDLQNMIEEYYELESHDVSKRLHIFLIPLGETGNTSYVVPVNEILDSIQLGTSLDSNQNFHMNHPTTKLPLVVKSGINPLSSTQFSNESQKMTRFCNQSPLSTSPLQHKDTDHKHKQLCDDRSHHDNTESNCSFITTKLPPENSSLRSAGYMNPLKGAVTLTDSDSSSERNDAQKPIQNHGGHFYNYTSRKDLACLPVINRKDYDFDELSSLLISSTTQDIPMKIQGNIHLTHPLEGNKLVDVESDGPQRKLDLHNFSPFSESLGSSNYIVAKSTRIIHEKNQIAKHGSRDSKLKIPNYGRDDLLNLDTIEETNEIDSFFHQDGNIHRERTNATGMQYKNNLIMNSIPTTPQSVDTSLQELQVSGIMNHGYLGADYGPCHNNSTEYHSQLEKIHNNQPVANQRTSSDQYFRTLVGGGQGVTVSGTVNLEFAAPNGLVFKKSTVFQHIKDQKDIGSQATLQINSKNLDHLVFDNSKLISQKNDDTMFLNLARDAALNGQVALPDKNFENYPEQKVDKLEFGVSVYDMSCNGGITLAQRKPSSKETDANRMEPLITLDMAASVQPSIQSSSQISPYVEEERISGVISPTATDVEDAILEYESEDFKASDGDKNESISDAMIAEMEASIYGLQVIKNADLEDLRELGSGTYGTVYHGKWRGTDVAIKRIKKTCFAGRSSEQERLIKDFWREAKILSGLHHPNVVAFYGIVPDDIGGTLATVTEYMVNGSLRRALLKKDRFLDHRKKLVIAMDAAFGMEYLHSKNIVHFDLKCDNLLVNLRDPQRPICKVGDFGLSRVKRNTLVSGGVRGTLPWMAPELLNGSSKVSEKVDVFSFGISMWEILTGAEPYVDMQCGAIIGGILKNNLRPPIPTSCDPEWNDLMEQCWSLNPENRPSFTEIANRLRSMYVALQRKCFV